MRAAGLLAGTGAALRRAGAVKSLRERDCYTGWGEELRYFFHRYEEYLARKVGQNFNNEQWNRIWETTAADSIEHIYPQTLGVSMGYATDEIHRLGNLLVLPPRLNSKLKDRWPGQKDDEYRNTGLLLVQELVGRLSDWRRTGMEERENTLLTWAVEEWAD